MVEGGSEGVEVGVERVWVAGKAVERSMRAVRVRGGVGVDGVRGVVGVGTGEGREKRNERWGEGKAR